MEGKTFNVEPLEASFAESSRSARRVYISPEVIRGEKLAAGDWVHLLPSSKTGRDGGVVAQLWPRVGLDSDQIMLAPSQLALLSASQVRLRKFDNATSRGLATLVLLKLSPPPTGVIAPPLAERETEWIKAMLKEALVSQRFIRRGMSIQLGDTPRAYEVIGAGSKDQDLASSMSAMKLNGNREEYWEVDWRTNIIVPPESDKGRTTDGIPSSGKPQPSYINIFKPSESIALGGLDHELKQIRLLLELPLQHPDLFKTFNITPPRGILLHGPPGTGKTALARAIASSTPSCSCIVVNGPELSTAFHGETEERLRGVFAEAKSRSPCIVFLDEIDALCPRRDGDGGEVEKRVVATLLTLMDGMVEEGRIFVIAATNRPNSVDPALRRPGRFDREIEIGIPDVPARQHILQVLLAKMPHSLSASDISGTASKTHGFVGADLVSLVREAASSAIQRSAATGDKPCLTADDVNMVLPTIRPSTMREIFIETPQVRWTDIGGQDEIKQKLRECVEWPLTHRHTFTRLGVEAPRGVLLYGPPGCSKTMTAKALATESGINFIAIKGPELLNKYVGESERAVREIFRKARAAAPSIVFFDEIDALGSARSEDMSHNGVLTSLLNEMDGIEELSGVTVVAATNRPDVLDSALMRPGRLDRILFVGAPDLATRRDIFRIRMASMAVDPAINIEELARLTEGCSGAEVASICQDAALAAMNEDLNAPYVKKEHFFHSAKTVRRRITPAMLEFFDEWRDQSGVRSA